MRKKIIAGNWKMNGDFTSLEKLIADLLELMSGITEKKVTVMVAPPFPFISNLAQLTSSSPIAIGAQNCSAFSSGAYTGEVSAAMLKSAGVEYIIAGHSERRVLFGETNAIIAKKIDQVLANSLHPIFCCGELLAERKEGNHFHSVEQQVEEGLFHLSEKEVKNVIIAYEPVWAIGTGETATEEQAQEMHSSIRKMLAKKYSTPTADEISILYGGSCNESNAEGLFRLPDVDGGLIGGASLKAESFFKIIQSMG